MRYNFSDNKVEDAKLAIAINIVNGKFVIGEMIPQKVLLADEYGVSRPTFNMICKELSAANVIREVENSYGRYYVPDDTKAIIFVLKELARRIKQTSKLLEAIGFGAREARNQLFIKQIINTLPIKLQEMKKDGRIQMYGNEIDGVGNSLLEQTKVYQEDVEISCPEMQDIIDVLQDML